MAPRSEHGVSTVLSTQVVSHDERTILVEAGGYTPARWFLEHGFQSRTAKEPPKKKRKTSHTESNTQDVVRDTFSQSSEMIPLFSVSLDFHFPETLSSKSASADAIAKDVDFSEATGIAVRPSVVQEEDSGATKLRLALPQPKGNVLLIECTAVAPHVLHMLRTIADPNRLKATTSARQKQAAVPSCHLIRSVGPLYTVMRLQATMHWQSGMSALQGVTPYRGYQPDFAMLDEAYPPKEVENAAPWTPADFYDSVHVTSSSENTEGKYERILDSDLFPFQKRAVSWMLKREKKPGAYDSPKLCEPVQDLNGKSCFVNHLQGIISREPMELGQVSGGILAEEMGLGKTVELMALMSLHPRPEQRSNAQSIEDESSETTDVNEAVTVQETYRYSGIAIIPSKATLIVTPASILEQWKTELARHAPALRVFHYQGIPKNSNAKVPPQEDVIKDLATKYDVVLTTYAVLTRELHFAEDPPERMMRHASMFERKRSPLVQLQWWRLCLDEAQMVESGVSAAAKVARRLPRVHSWAVSGTPLKKDIQDLRGLLIFLRYSPFDGHDGEKIWKRLVDRHRPLFRSIFNKMTLRHTKWHLRDEMKLPPQKRVVVTVPFTTIEQQHYSTIFAQMCAEVGVDHRGAPLRDDWDPEDPATIETMRTFLTRLRQTCLHPEIGSRNRRALGRGTTAGPLRTVGEVLEVMIEQNEITLRVDERAIVSASLLKAHIIGNNRENEARSQDALAVYQDALETAKQIVEDGRKRLAAAEATTAAKSVPEDEDDDAESTPLLGKLRNNLRTALQLQHVCTFFVATSYYQMKTHKPEESDEFKRLEEIETTYYDHAKQLRKELVSDIFRKAAELMKKIQSETLARLPAMKDLERPCGIKSRRIMEKSVALFDVITQQHKVLEDWRKEIVNLLTKPLVDDEAKDTTGEEYEDSTKQQDELFVYFDAFKAVHADLTTFLTGERPGLIDFEVEQYLRSCKIFFSPDVMESHKQYVQAPELGRKLFTIRQSFLGRELYEWRRMIDGRKVEDQRDYLGSVRGLIQEARAISGSMDSTTTMNAAENEMLKRYIAALQAVFSSGQKTLAGWEKEVDLFRQTQNQRVEYYRQLQELSDDVAPYKEELDDTFDQVAFANALKKEEKATKSLAESRRKNRFLLHLREESGSQAGPRICIICTSSFESGVLTVCGHQFCKDCLQQWFRQVRSCPMCKRHLTMADLNDITFKPQELRAQEEQIAQSSQPDQKASSSSAPADSTSIYTSVAPQLMSEIQSIDLPNSYGTKIDTLGRHLHWIREHDPGAKSIVFSQYREFLDVLGVALSTFKLGSTRLGKPRATELFKHDPSIDCLLLDAKTDSSGLTLVNATHVFICEPLIQTAVELQAIARVHRIGQTRATTVWMYLINDTVEESIYEISVRRRLAHVQEKKRAVTEETSTASELADAEELQAAPLTKLLAAGKSGGEMVGKDDLWQCLFGKTQAGDTGKESEAAQREVGRYLRGEAAEERRSTKGQGD